MAERDSSCQKLTLDVVEESLQNILKFLTPHLKLANTHASDFITKNHWDILQPEIQQELLSFPNLHLKTLPFDVHVRNKISNDTVLSSDECPDLTISEETNTFSSNESADDKVFTQLSKFCADASRCTIEGCRLDTSVSDLLKTFNSSQQQDFVGAFMDEKKCHEVEIMSGVCATLTKHCRSDLVLDFGSGKGYLSNQLVLQHGIPVIGADARDINTRSAERRKNILAKQWEGLERNVKLASSNQKLTKKEKKKLKAASDKSINDVMKSSGDGIDNSTVKSTHSQPNCVKAKSACKARFVPCTVYIDKETDFMDIVEKCIPEILEKRRNRLYSAAGDNCQSKQVCTRKTIHKLPNSFKHSYESVDMINDHIISNLASVSVSNDCNSEQSDRITKAEDESSCKPIICENSNAEMAVNYHLCEHCSCSDNSVEDGESLLTTERCEQQPPQNDFRILLTGLHTCGNLASTSVELFATSPVLTALCNVSCCYHFLHERFLNNEDNCSASDETEDEYGFPMSNFLTERKIVLGITARNLACQSVHRVAEANQLQGEQFYPRALLEKIVTDLCDMGSFKWTGLRKLLQKSTSDFGYIKAACHKLGVSDQISDDHIRQYLVRFKPERAKQAAFFQLKTILAPCIEALLVLDRVCFLLEQPTVRDVYLVKMFDPLISPRCYGIVALK
ncbi:probable methyltransferase-like protein 25 [Mya arenaria]|nr:probable methyltransferase-like protein 25 [Mya arenaria]